MGSTVAYSGTTGYLLSLKDVLTPKNVKNSSKSWFFRVFYPFVLKGFCTRVLVGVFNVLFGFDTGPNRLKSGKTGKT